MESLVWSVERTEKLVELRESGCTIEECARELGITVSSCMAKWKRLLPEKDSSPGWSKEEDRTLLGLFQGGSTISKISRQLGREKPYCVGRVLALTHPNRGEKIREWTEEEKKFIMKYDTLPMKELASALDRTLTACYHIHSKLKKETRSPSY